MYQVFFVDYLYSSLVNNKAFNASSELGDSGIRLWEKLQGHGRDTNYKIDPQNLGGRTGQLQAASSLQFQ